MDERGFDAEKYIKKDTEGNGEGVDIPETEKKEPDMKYIRQVSEFFRDQKEATKSDPEFVEYLEKCRKQLDTLGRKNADVPLNAGDIRLGIGELSRRVGSFNPVGGASTWRGSGDKELKMKWFQELFKNPRELFMETGKKVYPDVKVDFQRDFEDVVKELDKVDPGSRDIFEGRQSVFLKDEDPSALADGRKLNLRKIDAIESWIHYEISRDTQLCYENPDENETVRQLDRNQELDLLNKAMYKLELMRNQLNEELYGKPEIDTRAFFQ